MIVSLHSQRVTRIPPAFSGHVGPLAFNEERSSCIEDLEALYVVSAFLTTTLALTDSHMIKSYQIACQDWRYVAHVAHVHIS